MHNDFYPILQAEAVEYRAKHQVVPLSAVAAVVGEVRNKWQRMPLWSDASQCAPGLEPCWLYSSGALTAREICSMTPAESLSPLSSWHQVPSSPDELLWALTDLLSNLMLLGRLEMT
ncbi:hypothetical protein M0802_013097 [Mischocyttarus mexicanus]|nr:hypothetical protein M0802_013097 [Mischocyttarus mexicanus]